MRTVDLIQRKRDGKELAPEEIEFLIEGYTSGDIPDYQMSSFLMAVFFSGMSDREVRAARVGSCARPRQERTRYRSQRASGVIWKIRFEIA